NTMIKKIISSGIGVLLLTSPALALATTNPIEELLSQIQYLMKQIEILKAQQGANTNAAHSVTWGGVTMDYASDWSLTVNRPETDSDYSATLKDMGGQTVATLNKFYGGGDTPYTLVSAESF